MEFGRSCIVGFHGDIAKMCNIVEFFPHRNPVIPVGVYSGNHGIPVAAEVGSTNTFLGKISLGEITGFKRQICLTKCPFTEIIELEDIEIESSVPLSNNYLRSDANGPKQRADSGRRECRGIVVGSEA
ncbi:hypothetical protein MSAN_00398600 [Mycena sanguinolenta]|uniref:Uncharacterized protein n=1 Tax=Mycena sanguinolenta TaxID=230812 RepID=A0A8H6ZCH7_9AGAR|nr:hypothetical protein MSAN_00398600 [Mycena sanguinolenta]